MWQPPPVGAEHWYDSEVVKAVLYTLGGGSVAQIVRNIFEWKMRRIEQEKAKVGIMGDHVSVEASVAVEWQKLYKEQSDRLKQAEATCKEQIAAVRSEGERRVGELERRIDELEAQLFGTSQHGETKGPVI